VKNFRLGEPGYLASTEGAELMLVLSRQRDETIMIGDEIELTVVDIRGDKVRLGIRAPGHVAVHRKEVYEAIKRENEQAARLAESGGLQSHSLPTLAGRVGRLRGRGSIAAARVIEPNPDARRETA
jgi:carbon storage regulator